MGLQKNPRINIFRQHTLKLIIRETLNFDLFIIFTIICQIMPKKLAIKMQCYFVLPLHYIIHITLLAMHCIDSLIINMNLLGSAVGSAKRQ